MKHLLFAAFFMFAAIIGVAQENLTYQKPSEEILELVDVPRAPSVLLDDKQEHMLLIYRDAYKSIEELSQDELRLGGLRINPDKNIGSRTRYFTNLKIRNLKAGETKARQVAGLPEKPMMANFSWSPDQKKLAFTHTTDVGVELWVIDIENVSAQKLTGAKINANMGSPMDWFKDGEALLVKMLPEDRKPLVDAEEAVPTGPTVSVSEGETAQNRTYQDLLSSKIDEHNFEQLAKSTLFKVNLDGTKEKWLNSAMYRGSSFSPDGEYVLITTVEKPFSYLVPYYRFPSKTIVYTKAGQKVETILDVPLIEDLPKGFMAVRSGKRRLSWRADQPATLVFAKALDGGDPAKEADYRDEIFQLKAPFKGEGTSLLKTKNRYSYIIWGRKDLAIAYDRWWNTRNSKTYIFNPSNPQEKAEILFDRNYQDRYSDPGRFVTEENKLGRDVLALEGNYAFLTGPGYTPEGQFPFVDKLNLETHQKESIYRSEYKEKLEDIVNFEPGETDMLVRLQAPTQYPNYYFRDLKSGELKQLTNFENPFKSIQDVHKEVITYTREDGLELSATLYLPVGYDRNDKEKKPMIMWAYPREYKDRNSASQNTKNPNRFTYPFWGSPLYYLAQGYVVLDDAAFPIVGEGEEQPNDSFRKQLVSNAKAAIDAVAEMGYIDRNKVAVGGHSYGAFMVANLLSHSDLFAAGIARSGAYNRTLTPFGFQAEERNYWEAPEVYYNMSPFMHADKMKTPLLMIHGKADNNSGTYPMQSERYFNALKGLGATARLVMLPKESHGYSAKESILHMLWEQERWLKKYLKEKGTK